MGPITREVTTELGQVVTWIILGGIAGLLVEGFVGSAGVGLVGAVFVGVLGGLLGGWLFTQLGLPTGTVGASQNISAIVGAVVLLLLMFALRQA